MARSRSIYAKTTTALKAMRKNSGERQPQYLADDPSRRIVSVPNGLWQAQIRVEMERDCSREKDCWFAPHQPCTKEEAALQMRFGYGGRLRDFAHRNV